MPPSNWITRLVFLTGGIRCAGLQLNDIQLMGRPLRIGRPKPAFFYLPAARIDQGISLCQDGRRITSPLRRRCDQTLFPTQPFQPCRVLDVLALHVGRDWSPRDCGSAGRRSWRGDGGRRCCPCCRGACGSDVCGGAASERRDGGGRGRRERVQRNQGGHVRPPRSPAAGSSFVAVN